MIKRRFLCLALLLSIVLPLTAEDRVDMLLRHLRNPKSKRESLWLPTEVIGEMLQRILFKHSRTV